ncbi:FAD-dependent oxidoreductase [Mycobacterium rufum]|uniref:FAD-dependent oxidoreductase n=3 Tax=Mycobacteriaceae TaxID=1762 RepID=A0A9X2YDG3_9MYCO|nr:FAD-dependent oxidoreductase [Mycolicibacterium rufum]
MGSPYLLAHGLGSPVADATTTMAVHEAGRFHVWVRTKDWVPSHHPGRFTVTVDDITLEPEFGASGRDWSWEQAGVVELPQGEVSLVLHDLTGFEGRCDAIFFGRDDTPPPEGAGEEARSWRRRLRGLPDDPIAAGEFDVVVVGGGVTGAAAALTAARLGCQVALIQDRPYLGGNASIEIGLSPRGETGPLIDELSERSPDGDLYARRLLEAEPNATLVLEQTVYGVEMDQQTITSVDARDARSGREYRYCAPVFIDCTGTALLGLLSGAQTRFGQESRGEFDESLAPERGDDMHHGNTVFFRTRMAGAPVGFPDVPWALPVAKDFADLRGQLIKPGTENGPGPVAGAQKVPDPTVRRRMTHPLTHFWEYGQWLDPYTEGERIRDHLLCAIYGTFSNVKQLEPTEYANLELEWVAHVPAQGEYRRYVGDYTLTETDIRSHQDFPDAVVQNSGAFCLHYPGDEKYDFRLKNWIWDTRDDQPYDIPFRCLYSVNITNLMMAGKHISVTHVAGSNTKFMGNGGQHGIATAAAAFLCNKYSTTPRGIHAMHLQELWDVAGQFTGRAANR